MNEQSPPPESEVQPLGDDTTKDIKPSSLKSRETQERSTSPDTKAAAPGTTRELLRHLGWLMEEVVRGSQEKVGLAQAVYDSVRDKESFQFSLVP